MNDYNRGALPDPCLRLDYGFGDEWKSVELGDGTGYVRLSDYEKLRAENDKLRELVADMWICISHGSEGWDCTGCRRDPDVVCIRGISEFSQRMGELGIEAK